MSSNINSVSPYVDASAQDLQESIGITQFPDATSFYQIIGGLVIQGGLEVFTVTGVRTVLLPAPLGKQILSILITPVSAGTTSRGYVVPGFGLNSFDISHVNPAASYYWQVIGV